MTASAAASSCRAADLRCEYLNNPLGIDIPDPRLSWRMEDGRRGARQSAYQILVASSPDLLSEDRADVWDSGRVESNRSVHVRYDGRPVVSAGRYWWAVRIWDVARQSSPFSAPAYWEMGLLRPADWTAAWIGAPDLSQNGSSPLLRRAFSLSKPIRNARAYVTALGSYRLCINGARVGADLLTPDWTDYGKRVTYQTYDVTGLLNPGENAVGAMLGAMWYASPLGWEERRNWFGDAPICLRCQIRVDFEDGTSETIGSDTSWKVARGPITKAELYAGERYDARLEQPGWDRPGFDDRAWATASVIPVPDIILNAQDSQTIRLTQTIRPVGVTEPSPGVFIYDMGQNMVGGVRLRVQGPAGTTITLRHAEILQPDGALYTENLRKAEATDTYTLRGEGEELFEPHFTYHGFRYVEVSGYPGQLNLDDVTGLVFHTDLPFTGCFSCSSQVVNKVLTNISWGLRGNLESIPTDCPQRDERLGWMGDAQIIWRTASFMMNTGAFTRKFMRDAVDAQSPEGAFSDVSPRVVDIADGAPAWGDAGIVLPWVAWKQFGDTRIVSEFWEAMEKWMTYIHDVNPNFLWENRRNNDFGDWVPANSETPKDLIATAYWALDAMLMAQMARAIVKSADAIRYEELYANIARAFSNRFIQPDGTIGNGSQTCYVLALYMGLVPDDVKQAAVDKLVADIEARGWHLSTGFIGSTYLMPVLSDNGHNDVAYRLLLNEDYPSWGYMVAKGATTIWERWNGDTGDPGMNSFNHYAYGAVVEWLFRYVSGIDTDADAPGFERIVIRPRPGEGLSHAVGEYLSMYGRIVSEWQGQAGAGFSLNATVPANTTATIYVPARDPEQVQESGDPAASTEGVRYLRYEDGCAVYAVGAGSYRFTVSA